MKIKDKNMMKFLLLLAVANCFEYIKITNSTEEENQIKINLILSETLYPD